MVSIKGLSAALLAWATIANAFCIDGGVNICLNANVPVTATEDLYFQITAPVSAGWAGVGIGNRMRNALIFAIYPATDGNNVTLSPRIGRGNFEPEPESSIDIDILGGTGIKDGTMTVNFVCHNCRRWSGGKIDVTSSTQQFIWAIGDGDNYASNERSASIRQHRSRGGFFLDLPALTNGNGGNPFLSNNGSTNGNNQTDNNSGNNNNNNGTNDGNNNEDGGRNGGSGGGSLASSLRKEDKTLIVHGVLMAVSFLIFFPLGAIIIRFLAQVFPRPVPLYLHAGLQITTFLLTIIGMAFGIYTSDLNGTHWVSPHQFLGIVLMSLLFLQIPLGIIHHVNFKSTGGRTWWSHLHIWNGRVVVLVGIVNGGLGLRLAGIKKRDLGGVIGKVDKGWVVAYAVVAGVVALVYFAGWMGKALMRGAKASGREKEGKGGNFEDRGGVYQ